MTHAWIAIGLLIAASSAGAVLLKWARCPGWAIVGGAVAGLMLGPMFMGRIAPDLYERSFVGGQTQRADCDIRKAAITQALSSEDRDLERIAGLRTALDEAQKQYETARWEHRQPLRSALCIVVGIVMLGGALRQMRLPKAKHHIMAKLSIGLWAVALPAGCAALCAHWLLECDLRTCLIIGTACSVGPWAFTAIDRKAADDAEIGGAHLLHSAGRYTTLLALHGVWIVLVKKYGFWNIQPPVIALALLPIGWTVGRLIIKIKGPAADPDRTTFGDRLLELIALPTLAAMIGLRADPLTHLALLFTILLIIVSGDGRWIGALLGAILPGGRKWLRTMRLVMGSMAAGPTQLAVASIALWYELIPEPAALALLFGAVYIEISTPLRRTMAKQLVETEEELRELEEEEDAM